jgi:hypothetical protein
MKRLITMAAAMSMLAGGGTALAKGTKVDAGAKAGTTKLLLKVGPEDTEIWVDGQKKGTAEKVKELSLTPGPHEVVLKHHGDERSDQVVLKKGATTTFEWKFEDDRPKPNPTDEEGAAQAPTDVTPPSTDTTATP